MGIAATSFVISHPSFMERDLIIQQNQSSGAFETLAGGNPRVKIGSEDKNVYIPRVDVRTKVQINQAAGNLIPSCEIVPSLISAPTYLQRVRAEYDHHDTAMAGVYGIALPEAQRLAMRQGHFQLARNNLLYGVLPGNGEGLLNANGATAVTLPADTFGDDSIRTYDNGQMAFFLLQQLSQIKSRTNQLGIPRRFVFLLPQRAGVVWEYSGIVQVTSYQRQGAGTVSIAGVVKDVAKMNGDEVLWCYDDTLIGQGAGGTDAILCVMPEIDIPDVPGMSTNEFGKMTPNFKDCVTMYADVAAPIEIPTPLPGGAIDVLSEMRMSPGWAVRPEALTILSMTY
jgi:hypothetical protein